MNGKDRIEPSIIIIIIYNDNDQHIWAGWDTPYDGPYGEAPSELKGYLFQALGIWKGRDFTVWSTWKGWEICHLGLWKGPKGLTDEFYGFIRRENVLFLWLIRFKRHYIHSRLKGMQSSKQDMWKGYHLSKKDIRKENLFREKWYIEG